MKKISFLIFFSILIIIFSLLFFRSKGSFSSVDSGITKIFSPVGMVFANSTGGIRDFFVNLGNIGNLQKENADLRDKKNQLEAQVAKMSANVKETDSLKRELGFRDDSGFETIPADISFFDPTNIRGTVVINKGKNQGVDVNMAATSQGMLIGRVTEVYSDSAKILLITDPFSRVPAQLTSVDASGLVQGQVGMGLIINEVPQETDLRKGETIVTSGLGGQYPKGLILGTVENVNKKNNSIFQSASLRTLVDFKSLERVQVIKNK